MLRLVHPNVVHSFFLPTVNDSVPIIMMELMPLGDLRSFVTNRYVWQIRFVVSLGANARDRVGPSKYSPPTCLRVSGW